MDGLDPQHIIKYTVGKKKANLACSATGGRYIVHFMRGAEYLARHYIMSSTGSRLDTTVCSCLSNRKVSPDVFHNLHIQGPVNPRLGSCYRYVIFNSRLDISTSDARAGSSKQLMSIAETDDWSCTNTSNQIRLRNVRQPPFLPIRVQGMDQQLLSVYL